MKRNAIAEWQGSGKEGKGTLSTQSGTLNQTQYSYLSRFAEGTGTNPEELIAAAHAGCFTMKLSFTLDGAGFTAENLETKCVVTLDNGAVTSSALTLNAKVPGIDPDQFHELAALAKKDCPISKLLNCEITLEAKLEH
jgi:osmotically inducible protein OsmC